MSEPAISIEHLSKHYRLDVRPFEAVTSIWRRRRSPWTQREDPLEDDDEDEVDEEPGEPREEAPRGGSRQITALDDVSLEIAPGARLALLGPPASGKTTLLKVVARITPPSAGRAVVRGRVAPLLELASAMMNPYATGRANAFMLARLLGVPRDIVERHLTEIFDLAELSDRIDHQAGTYSSRHYRRVGLASVLCLEPDILLVDERLVAGDPDFAERCEERLREAAAQGLTLVFAAREPEAVADFCDEAVWLSNGQLLERGALGEARPARPLSRRFAAHTEKPRSLVALSPTQHDIVERLVIEGRAYAEVAAAVGGTPEEVRDEARRAFEALAPDGGRLSPDLRASIADHLLAQPRPGADPASVFARPEARVWARMLTALLAPLGQVALADYPRQAPGAGEETAGGLAPPLEPAAAALTDFVEVAFGARRARDAVTMATDKAVWKELRRVKWSDVAEAAELPPEDARAVVDRLLRLRATAGLELPAAHGNGGQVALIGSVLLGADGEPAEALQLGEPATVETTLETAVPAVELRLQILLESSAAPPLRLAQPEPFRAEAPGRYRVRAHLPAGLLQDAHYAARVLLGARLDGHLEQLELRDAFTFEAFELGDTDPEAVEPSPPVAWEVVS